MDARAGKAHEQRKNVSAVTLQRLVETTVAARFTLHLGSHGGQVWAVCPSGRIRRHTVSGFARNDFPEADGAEVNSTKKREEKMIQRETVVAQLGAMGRCAMVGTLIGLMTTQAFAAGVPAAAPETTSITNNESAIAANATANLPLAAADATALPAAPSAPEEQASVTKPLDIRAVMDDAAQNTQNLQPAATQQKQHQAHPGWLVLSAIGAIGVWMGAEGLANGSKRSTPVAGAFLGVGAGLTGLGLYLTFK
jgi:hypothetical protein